MLPFHRFNLEDCVLKPQRIDIWQITLDDYFPEACIYLNDEELARTKRFYFDKHRKRFANARAMLRIILSKYLKISPQEINFAYKAHGKPFLHHPCAIEFNISHSQNKALIAVGKTNPLGIDLECFSARPYCGIARQLFSDEEYRLFSSLPKPQKTLGFFHLWAQKEALIKACGLGLSYPTKSISLPMLTSTQHSVFDPIYKDNWNMTTFMPQIFYWGALCCHPIATELRYRQVNVIELKPLY